MKRAYLAVVVLILFWLILSRSASSMTPAPAGSDVYYKKVEEPCKSGYVNKGAYCIKM